MIQKVRFAALWDSLLTQEDSCDCELSQTALQARAREQNQDFATAAKYQIHFSFFMELRHLGSHSQVIEDGKWRTVFSVRSRHDCSHHMLTSILLPSHCKTEVGSGVLVRLLIMIAHSVKCDQEWAPRRRSVWLHLVQAWTPKQLSCFAFSLELTSRHVDEGFVFQRRW